MTIKELRLEKGLSRAAFAKALGISVSSLDNYESGRRSPGGKALTAIMNVYGLDLSDPGLEAEALEAAEVMEAAEAMEAIETGIAVEAAAANAEVEDAAEEAAEVAEAGEAIEEAEAMETAGEAEEATVDAAEEAEAGEAAEAVETAGEAQEATVDAAEEAEAGEAAEAVETAGEVQEATVDTAEEAEAGEAAEAVATAGEAEEANVDTAEEAEAGDSEAPLAEAPMVLEEAESVETAVEEAIAEALDEAQAEEAAALAAAGEKAARKAEKKARKAEKLAARQQADEEAIQRVIDVITALSGSLGLEDSAAVAAARDAYDSLSDDQELMMPGDVLRLLFNAEQMIENAEEDAAREASKSVPIEECRITVKDVAYTGRRIKKPSVKAVCGEVALKPGEDYRVKYDKKARDVGLYMLTVKGKGRFTGAVKVPFYVVPKAAVIARLLGGDKQAARDWKLLKNIEGCQVEYSADKDFSHSKKAKLRKPKDLEKALKKLKAGKKYYLRVRIFATVKKKRHYSDWSKVKTVKL